MVFHLTHYHRLELNIRAPHHVVSILTYIIPSRLSPILPCCSSFCISGIHNILYKQAFIQDSTGYAFMCEDQVLSSTLHYMSRFDPIGILVLKLQK